MAVRQLKRYASWVQTVQKLKSYNVKSYKVLTIVQSEPKRNCLKEGEIINKITNISRRSHEVIYVYEVDLYR